MKCNELQNTEEWQWFRCDNSITVVDLVSNVYLFLEVLLLVSHYCIQALEIVNVLSFHRFFVVYSFDWELVLGMSCLRQKKALRSIQAIYFHFINYICYNLMNIIFIDELNFVHKVFLPKRLWSILSSIKSLVLFDELVVPTAGDDVDGSVFIPEFVLIAIITNETQELCVRDVLSIQRFFRFDSNYSFAFSILLLLVFVQKYLRLTSALRI